MTDYADLEIGLQAHPAEGSYRVELRLRLPRSQGIAEPPSHEDLHVAFDLEALSALERDLDYDGYGQLLARYLFAPDPVGKFLSQARTATQPQGRSLRLRLRIGSGAQELHALRWELLRDPEPPGGPLATSERVVFSRYLASSDIRTVDLPRIADIGALVIIANPSDLAGWQGEAGARLDPVPVAGELARARKALDPIPVTALYSDAALAPAGRPTLQEMLAHLRDGYQVLYLVCHGALSEGGTPQLWLEDETGRTDLVVAADTTPPGGQRRLGLINELAALERLPHLVILASCESAGAASRDTRALSALGPRLVKTGVPAVLAMQGRITMGTVEAFMPRLFRELQRDGQIDRAVAAARRAVHERWDWWLPVLFTRLESGRLFEPETPPEAPTEAQLDTLRAERLVVERLEVAGAPTRPTTPLRTRIPEPRAGRLVGRGDELDWLCRRLKAGGVAAIAGLRGIGGIGKTELAIAAARRLEAHFEGRVIWLDCGPNDAHAIQERLAAAVGAGLESDDLQVRADALAAALRGQPPALVVLDDLRRRHLADLDCLKPPRPPCALLVTSRRRDLDLPRGSIRSLDVLEPAEARELLAALLPGGWLEEEPEAAAGVVEFLEGIPLALGLAARRAERIAGRRDASAGRPMAALLDELRRRRVQVLNQGEDPDRPDLSVVITFDASHDDLEPGDRARLRRLGVFARNEFELPALQAVWGDGESEARQALERLVNAGLLEELG